MSQQSNQSGSNNGSDAEQDLFLAEIRVTMLAEAQDLMTSAEGAFLELEKNPENSSEMEKILRLFHNLKGSCGSVNFSSLSQFCHKIENLLVQIRDKKLQINSQSIELLLKCSDEVKKALEILTQNHDSELKFEDSINLIENMLNQGQSPGGVNGLKKLQNTLSELIVLADATQYDVLETLKSELHKLVGLSGLSDKSIYKEALLAVAEIEKILTNKEQNKQNTQFSDHVLAILDKLSNTQLVNTQGKATKVDPKLWQSFVMDAHEQIDSIDHGLINLEKDPSNKEGIDSVFRGMHTLKSSASMVGFAEIEELAHHFETMLGVFRDHPSSLTSKSISLLLEGTHHLKDLIKKRSEGSLSNKHETLGTTSIYKSRETSQTSSAPLSATPLSASSVKSTAEAVPSREPIRVDADRLDRLVDFLGELVIAETMVSQSKELGQINPTMPIFKHLDRLNKITRGLQEIGLALRMVPARQTFRKMIRTVRDISKKVNKEVDFVLVGEEIEMDRSVAEKIGDPLVHMVRNAIDHGLEKNAEDRIKAGKPAMGHVTLKAAQKGGNIWIELQDDGRGIDKEVILNKAIQKGIVQPGANLSDSEIYKLIFAPGFSTAEQVTDVSGRGVGMDVVRRNVEEIRGQIDIETKKGHGTLFRIRIPNTLAILEGMVVQVGKERYVFPTQSIMMAIKPLTQNLVKATGVSKDELIQLHGEVMPFYRLSKLYQITGAVDMPEQGIVLVAETRQKKIGILVDKILNQQQFVIKNLGPTLGNVPGVSGGTILPDGEVGLIIDVDLLAQSLMIDWRAQATPPRASSNTLNEVGL